MSSNYREDVNFLLPDSTESGSKLRITVRVCVRVRVRVC